MLLFIYLFLTINLVDMCTAQHSLAKLTADITPGCQVMFPGNTTSCSVNSVFAMTFHMPSDHYSSFIYIFGSLIFACSLTVGPKQMLSINVFWHLSFPFFKWVRTEEQAPHEYKSALFNLICRRFLCWKHFFLFLTIQGIYRDKMLVLMVLCGLCT